MRSAAPVPPETIDAAETWRAEIRRFLADHPPEAFPCEHGDLGYGFGAWSSAFLRALGDRGWIGLAWPAAVGGAGRPLDDLYALFTELAYARAPAEALLYSLAVGYCVAHFGSPELQADFLPGLLGGRSTFCEALTEPAAGSDLLGLRTSAREADEGWRIDGHKIWTSNGHLADFALLAARTSPDLPRHRGISVFLVDLSAPGVTRRPIVDLAGEPSYSELFLDDVAVPRHWIVGERDGGLKHVLQALEWDRLWGRCVKAPFLRRELEDLVAYCRRPSPTGEVLWESEVVRDTAAALAVDIEVCEAVFERAFDSLLRGSSSATHEVSMAKVLADELGQRFYDRAGEIVAPAPAPGRGGPEGGGGASLARRVQAGALAAHGLLLAGGTPEIQRNTVATRHLGLGRR